MLSGIDKFVVIPEKTRVAHAKSKRGHVGKLCTVFTTIWTNHKFVAVFHSSVHDDFSTAERLAVILASLHGSVEYIWSFYMVYSPLDYVKTKAHLKIQPTPLNARYMLLGATFSPSSSDILCKYRFCWWFLLNANRFRLLRARSTLYHLCVFLGFNDLVTYRNITSFYLQLSY